MSRILIVEDSDPTCTLLKDTLGSEHELTFAGDVAGGYEAGKAGGFDLMLVDVTLPDGEGFALCQRLAQALGPELPPFIFISGRYDVQDKLTGFAVGAEDYVVKPFEPLELKARVDIRLRRRQATATAPAGPAVDADLRVDVAGLRVSALSDGEERDLGLTPNEFRLLQVLLAHPGKPLSRAEILGIGWGGSVHVLERTIDRHVSSLRRKLGGLAQRVESVPGQGYRWNALRKA
jgi:DNA-binding response OmpR family regulator